MVNTDKANYDNTKWARFAGSQRRERLYIHHSLSGISGERIEAGVDGVDRLQRRLEVNRGQEIGDLDVGKGRGGKDMVGAHPPGLGSERSMMRDRLRRRAGPAKQSE